MNWRYWVGSSINNAIEAALRGRVPGRRYLPAGQICAFDVNRFYDRRKLSLEVILDIGANLGRTCLYLRRWFPSAQIFLLEPVRSTYETLVGHTVEYPNIRCRNVALGDRQGSGTIRLMRNSELNSLNIDPALDGEDLGIREQVELTTLAEFCRGEGLRKIDLLKMDVQGHELRILSGAGEMLSQSGFILTEVGLQEQRTDVTPFGTMHEFLRDHGFFFCSLYDGYRHWDAKLLVSFANALYVNPKWFNAPPGSKAAQ